MSKPFRYFCLIILFGSPAFQTDARRPIKYSTPLPLTVLLRIIYVDGKPLARVAGVFNEERRPEFRKSFSLSHLGARRAQDIEFHNSEGKRIGFRELANGEYLA